MRIHITIAFLLAHEACEEGIEWYRAAYPDGIIDWSGQGILDFFAAGGGPWYGWAYGSRMLPSLSRADLSGADLRAADLGAADLRAADLGAADLNGADLSNADLRYADLRGADLRDANLSNANLSNANLRGHDAEELESRGAIL